MRRMRALHSTITVDSASVARNTAMVPRKPSTGSSAPALALENAESAAQAR